MLSLTEPLLGITSVILSQLRWNWPPWLRNDGSVPFLFAPIILSCPACLGSTQEMKTPPTPSRRQYYTPRNTGTNTYPCYLNGLCQICDRTLPTHPFWLLLGQTHRTKYLKPKWLYRNPWANWRGHSNPSIRGSMVITLWILHTRVAIRKICLLCSVIPLS